MPSRKRHRPGGRPYPEAIFMRLEGSARVGWAKWYDAERRNDDLEHANTILVDRIETLVPECLGIVEAVLRERNIEAFCRAYRIAALVHDYQHGGRCASPNDGAAA